MKNVSLNKIEKEKSMKEILECSIINIDKPDGPTSYQVTAFVRDALGLNKACHLGTLE